MSDHMQRLSDYGVPFGALLCGECTLRLVGLERILDCRGVGLERMSD